MGNAQASSARRIGWLLHVNRAHAVPTRYRRLRAFADDFNADPDVRSVSISALSRWENGISSPPHVATRRYEDLLRLKPGLLSAVSDTVSRYAEPPTRSVPVWARLRRPAPGTPLDELVDLATSGAVMSGAQWDRLSELLACRPDVVLSPNSTWRDLSERLLTETAISDGLAWMRRAEAFHRIIGHPQGQFAAIAAAADAVDDSSAQSMIGTVTLFNATPHPFASASVVRHILNPATDRNFYGALLTSIKKLRYGHLTPDQASTIAPVLVDLTNEGEDDRAALAALLIRLLPAELQRRLSTRARRTVAETLQPANGELPVRLSLEAARDLDPADNTGPDGLLALFLRELLYHPNMDVRLCAAFLVYATPYREPVARALAREFLDTARRRGPEGTMRALVEGLRVLGGAPERRLLERTLLDRWTSEAVLDSAAYALGHIGGSSHGVFWRQTVDLYTDRLHRSGSRRNASILDRLIYAIGISGRRDVLRQLQGRHDVPADARAAALWWDSIPDHLRQSARL